MKALSPPRPRCALSARTTPRRRLARYDLSALRYLFFAGERLDPDTYHWATQKLGIPVIDHWWQTETGWAIAANPLGVEALPIKPGSPTVPMPGYDVRILHPDGTAADPAKRAHLPQPAAAAGHLARRCGTTKPVRALLPVEHPGYYLTGDGGYIDEDGYLFVMGRIDDVINVAGHRLSTGCDGGGAGGSPRGGRMRRDRRPRRNQRPGPPRVRRPEGRRSAEGLASECGRARPRRDRCGGVLKQVTSSPHCQRHARARYYENDARHRPRTSRAAALDHRRSRRTAYSAPGAASVGRHQLAMVPIVNNGRA